MRPGDRASFTATFKNEAGTLYDPPVIELRFKLPDGTFQRYYKDTVGVTNPSVGVYKIVKSFPAPGPYVFAAISAEDLTELNAGEFQKYEEVPFALSKPDGYILPS